MFVPRYEGDTRHCTSNPIRDDSVETPQRQTDPHSGSNSGTSFNMIHPLARLTIASNEQILPYVKCPGQPHHKNEA